MRMTGKTDHNVIKGSFQERREDQVFGCSACGCQEWSIVDSSRVGTVACKCLRCNGLLDIVSLVESYSERPSAEVLEFRGEETYEH